MGKIINCFEDDRTEEDKIFEDLVIKTASVEYQSPFLKIPNPMLRSNIFTQWVTVSKAQSWLRLYSYIIRGKMNNKLALHLYYKYYVEKHKLIARFTQEGLAQSLSYTDRRAVSKHLIKLEQEGTIKVIVELWNNRNIRLYEFGTWFPTDGSKSERLHLYAVMRKLIGEAKLNELEG